MRARTFVGPPGAVIPDGIGDTFTRHQSAPEGAPAARAVYRHHDTEHPRSKSIAVAQRLKLGSRTHDGFLEQVVTIGVRSGDATGEQLHVVVDRRQQLEQVLPGNLHQRSRARRLDPTRKLRAAVSFLGFLLTPRQNTPSTS